MRDVVQVWPAPPMNLWTEAYADMLTGKLVPWQARGEEGGWGIATKVVVEGGGERLRITVLVDPTLTYPPF